MDTSSQAILDIRTQGTELIISLAYPHQPDRPYRLLFSIGISADEEEMLTLLLWTSLADPTMRWHSAELKELFRLENVRIKIQRLKRKLRRVLAVDDLLPSTGKGQGKGYRWGHNSPHYRWDIPAILNAGGELPSWEALGVQERYGPFCEASKFPLASSKMSHVLDALRQRWEVHAGPTSPIARLPEVPRLTPELASLVGSNRRQEIVRIEAMLATGPGVLIEGVGGVGKSTLAVFLAERSQADRLVIWHEFLPDHGESSSAFPRLLRRIADQLGEPSFREVVGTYFQASTNRELLLDVVLERLLTFLDIHRVLLILDRLEVLIDGVGTFADPAFERLCIRLVMSHQARFLVTTRLLPVLSDVECEDLTLRLGSLSPDGAAATLAFLGLSGLKREYVTDLLARAAGHPLALRLLVEAVHTCGANDVLADQKLWQAQAPESTHLARRLFDRLTPKEKAILARLSVYDSPVPRAALMAQATDGTDHHLINSLLCRGLVSTHHQFFSRFGLHPLMSEMAAMAATDELPQSHLRAARWFEEVALKAQPVQAGQEIYIMAVEAACRHVLAASTGDAPLPDGIARIATLVPIAVGSILKRGEPQRARGLMLPLLSMWETAGIAPDQGLAYARMLVAAGDVLVGWRNDAAAARYGQAAVHSALRPDERNRALIKLGIAHRLRGDYVAARQNFTAALALARTGDHQATEALAHSELGEIDWLQGDLAAAQAHFEMVQNISLKLDETDLVNWNRFNLGNVAYLRGDYDQAYQSYEAQLSEVRDNGDKRAEIRCLLNLACVYIEIGDLDRGISAYLKVMEIAELVGDLEVAAIATTGILYMHLREGDNPAARSVMARAQSLIYRLDSPRWLAILHKMQGLLELQSGNLDSANSCLIKAADIARAIGDKYELADILEEQGHLALKQGNLDTAATCLTEASALFQEIGFRQGVAGVLHCAGLLAEARGDRAAALGLLGQASNTQTERGGREWPSTREALVRLGQ